MANSIVQPYIGPISPDLTPIKDILVDLAAGTTRGLRREKDGIENVISELQNRIPANASTLGVAPDIHQRVLTLTEQLDQVRKARVIIDKLSEILEETEAYLEDDRENEIGLVVNAVRGAARRKDPALIVAFEETARYHGQVGVRAHKTRRKNAEQADAQHVPEAPPPAQTTGGPPIPLSQ